MRDTLTRDDVRGFVRAVWEDVFETTVQDDTDFFDLGGNSISALAICTRLEESLQRRLTLRVLLTHPEFTDYVREVWKIVQESQ